ncbi:Mediator of RNA polymerase II transcription subunit 21 [Sphaceloma murrayae]|uniref:Mediator of RNA polymerase II transcription subunit 21 n=1 Tax=Sphaceloma murrayae TaxID=2082308 RepID=A0A2K1QPQ8_9PEZI|nr:Mediator of RNA polymerase II transcription subunit 21 [Sphaceloma murrayae]
MADRLTQLQDCLDDLATQMFASLRYINAHHSFASIPGQPDQAPTTQKNEDGTQTTMQDPANDIVPDDPALFQASLRELARDLVLKEQQIEYLIKVLPGIGNSEKEQNERIEKLDGELREIEGERKEAARERDQMKGLIEGLVKGMRRVY